MPQEGRKWQGRECLFRGLNGSDDFVHDVAVGGCAGEVVVNHDGEDDSTAAGRVEIAGEGAGFAEGSGLGKEMVFEWRIGKAVFEGSVLAADGERGFPGGEPGLGGGELEELGGGAGGDEVVAGEAGAVDEVEVVGVDADRLDQKLLGDRRVSVRIAAIKTSHIAEH